MYKYYNRTPDKGRKEDCVVRAISTATNREYEDIQKKLWLTSKLYECEERNVCCYRTLIENVFDGMPVECRGMTVGEFSKEYPQGIYLVRTNGHITTVIDGDIYDTFDCSPEIVTNAWKIQ